MVRSNRAGRYVRQLGGYPAFIPHPLPPEAINTGGDLQELLSKADRALGRLDGSIQVLPNADLFVAMYVRKEAVLSSQIEGTQSSLQDVIAAEANIFSHNVPSDVDEVFNYVRAMNAGLERLNTLPISIRLIREIHAELLQGVRGERLSPGELRTSQNWIGAHGCSLSEAVFVPPPPGEVPQALSDLEKFIHTQTNLPLLLKIGLAHAQFETIHPFLDGNGRIGRLLITFLLCEREVLAKPVLYLSHYFKRYRKQYYEHLQAIRDEGAWEEWLLFFLQGVYDVSRQATETAQRIILLREKHREKIVDSIGSRAGNGHRLLEALYKRPIVSVKNVQEQIDTSYQAANNLVNSLVEIRILRELTEQARNRRFIYQDYVNLFYEDEPLVR